MFIAFLALALSSCASSGTNINKPNYMSIQDKYMDETYTTLSGTLNGLNYYTATVSGVKQAVVDQDRDTFSGTALTVPGTYNDGTSDYSVVGIKESAFYDEGLTSVSLPDGLTMIGSQAFGNCSFSSFTIPSGVTTLNPETFIRCPNLVTLTFSSPSSVTSIEDHCFDGDFSLKGIKFSTLTSLSSIGASAFSYCRSLTNVLLPTSLTSLGSFAFDDCSGIATFFLPNSLTSIGQYALKGVSNSNIIAISSFSSDPYTNETSPYKKTWRNKDLVTQITFTWSTGFESSSNNDGFFYTVSDGKATITGYNGSSAGPADSTIHLYIPETLGGSPVTAINNYVFLNHTELHCVNFPSSLVSIGTSAFQSCKLYEINFSANGALTTISDSAFYSGGNNYLTTLVIPTSVVTIGSYAFRGYNTLNSITFTGASDNTAHLQSIGEHAFMPENQNHGVAYADATNDLVFPNTLTSIGDSAFAWCHYLKSITFMDNDDADITLSIAKWAFSRVYNVQTITFSKNLKSIGQTAFEHLTEAGNQNRATLHSVYIPSSVTNISSGAFAACNGIKFYCQLASAPSGWNENWNSYTAEGGTINPNGKMSTLPTYWNVGSASGQRKLVSQGGAAGSFDFIQNVNDSGTPVDSYTCSCFYYQGQGSTAERTATVPSSITIGSTSYPVTAIGQSAFYRSVNTTTSGKGLQNISLPSSIVSIGAYAFANCTELAASLDLSSCTALTTIGSAAFGWDTTITSLTLSHSIATIGSGSSFGFYGCTNIATLKIIDSNPVVRTGLWTDNSSPAASSPNIIYNGKEAVFCAPKYDVGALVLASGAESVADSCFYGNGYVTSVNLPASMKTIKSNAFVYCSNLATVSGGSGLTSTGAYAFYGDSALTSVSFSSMTSFNDLGYGTFYASGLQSADLSATALTKITGLSFSNCASLASVSLPSTASLTIESSAFSGDSSLSTLNWGSTIASIGSSAFSGCSGLISLSIPNTVTAALGESAFASCTGLTSLTIGSGVPSIGASCFSGDSALASVSFDASYVRETSPITTAYAINSAAFKGCSFSSIVLPYGASFTSGLSSGGYVFEGNNSLNAIYLRSTGAYYVSDDGVSHYPQGWNFKANGEIYKTYHYAATQSDVASSYGDNMSYWHYVNDVPTAYANVAAIPAA